MRLAIIDYANYTIHQGMRIARCLLCLIVSCTGVTRHRQLHYRSRRLISRSPFLRPSSFPYHHQRYRRCRCRPASLRRVSCDSPIADMSESPGELFAFPGCASAALYAARVWSGPVVRRSGDSLVNANIAFPIEGKAWWSLGPNIRSRRRQHVDIRQKERRKSFIAPVIVSK